MKAVTVLADGEIKIFRCIVFSVGILGIVSLKAGFGAKHLAIWKIPEYFFKRNENRINEPKDKLGSINTYLTKGKRAKTVKIFGII